MLLLRSRLGVCRVPSGCSHDATAPTVVHLFLCHDHSIGSGHTSEITIFLMENTVRAENLLNLFVLFLFFLCAVSCHGGGVDIHNRYVSWSNAKGRTTGAFSDCILLFLLLQSAHHDHWGQYLMTVYYMITMSFSIKNPHFLNITIPGRDVCVPATWSLCL